MPIVEALYKAPSPATLSELKLFAENRLIAQGYHLESQSNATSRLIKQGKSYDIHIETDFGMSIHHSETAGKPDEFANGLWLHKREKHWLMRIIIFLPNGKVEFKCLMEVSNPYAAIQLYIDSQTLLCAPYAQYQVK